MIILLYLHYWIFKFAQKYENKNQKCKINSCAYRFTSALTTIVLLFLVSMPSAKQVKDDALLNSSGRLITASFLIKTLLITWEDGEKYFSQHLTDYDPASNNGNWQWVASTGADS